MGTREDLARAEEERWGELDSVLDGLPEERLGVVGVTPEWSAKDLMAHLACWMGEAAGVLERIRLGTWDRAPADIDGMNDRFYAQFRDADLATVRSELQANRARMLQEWQVVPEIDEDAEEWFRESGPSHLEEHLPELRRFAEGNAA
jgi:hypothetical protein